MTEGMRAEVPGEQPDWDDRCRMAVRKLYISQQAIIDANSPAEMPQLLGRLAAARHEFGSALLALDKKRRPSFYTQKAPPPL